MVISKRRQKSHVGNILEMFTYVSPRSWSISIFLGLPSSGPSLWKQCRLVRFIGKWIIHGIISVFFLNLWATLKFTTHSLLT